MQKNGRQHGFGISLNGRDTSEVSPWNWDSAPGDGFNGALKFVPILWGLGQDHVDKHIAEIGWNIEYGADAVMGFNEPNLYSANNNGACLSVTDAKIDNIAVHWYGPANADEFKNHIKKAISVAGGRQIYISEFGFEGYGESNDRKQRFFRDVLSWLDAQGGVLSYSYLPIKDLIADGQVTTLGHLYMDL
ncbi:hypothetical protein LTS18_008991 [Coniosporium uncinatum]|uniref:Uncharacterized protein n=1 Tax=Coniosporium uncinatum TaxID=93489 RepID=A0ACC3DWY2_9PEZI|nr:hypothetical protein LTS18_008991 [Coniosporium uncinatum]